MTRKHRLAIALGLGLTLCASAWAQVRIEQPWVRGTVPGQQAAGMFMHIHADQDVSLIGGQTPVAGAVEVHEMSMQGDVMKMRALPDGLPIAKGGQAALEPGGYHIMLMQLKQPLQAGDTVPITLHFRDASGKIIHQQLKAPVKALGSAAGHDHDHHGHGHKH